MVSALLKLQENMNRLNKTEQIAAEYLLQNTEAAARMNIRQLGEATFVSPSTIVRMCRKLGFDGFRELRQSLTYDMALRQNRVQEGATKITKLDNFQEVVEKITYKNIMALEETRNLMDVETLAKCVELVEQCRLLLFFGAGASLLAAQDAYLKFLRFGKPCIVNTDYHCQLLQAENSRREDVALVLSYSGRTREVIDCMRALRQNGTPIIAVTRNVKSPVSEMADFKLYTTDKEEMIRIGAMSSRISQMNVMDILYTAFTQRKYEEAVRQAAKTYIRKVETVPETEGGQSA